MTNLITEARELCEKQSIVYCKDCKYLGIKDFVYGYCKRDMNGQVQPDDRCVCCGRYTPEGRDVCPLCKKQYERSNHYETDEI